jgi:two-component system response regulator
METNQNSLNILMADDDADDCLLLMEGLKESQIDFDLRHVPDGDALMDYLQIQSKFIDPEHGQRHLIILLDLNMPGKDGRDVLIEIKSIPELKHIPVVVYTSSTDEEDVRRCYALGANSYIIKRAGWDQFIHMIKSLFSYWTRTVRLPKVEFIASPKNADQELQMRLDHAV